MRRWITSLVVFLSLTTIGLVAGQASAQEVTKSVTITRDSRLGGKQVAKGGYEIRFVEGKDGEMVLTKGKQEITKANYRLAKLDRPAADNTVAYITGEDGTFAVKRIELKGKIEALVFE
jgi:hypothetical protein